MLEYLILASGVVAQEFSSFSAGQADNANKLNPADTKTARSFLASKFLQPAASYYTPEAWNAMTIFERLQAYHWTKELIILGFILAYVALHFIGLSFNKNKVASWIRGHKQVLDAQFYQVGVHAKKAGQDENDMMILTETDGATAFSTYATGRLNVQSLIVRFRLLGRQNFITLFMEYGTSFFVKGLTPKDAIDVVITPDKTAAKSIEQGIFAVVNKEKMREARDNNYYLSLTRTIDSTKLPVNFTFMTEATEMNDVLYTEELAEAINMAESCKVLNYIAITDQASNAPSKPEDTVPQTLIALSLNYPSNDAQAKASAAIVNAAINLVDKLTSKKAWRPEVAKKVKATREAETKKILRAIENEKAEKLALKKAEQKREESRSEKYMSVAEQKKLDEKRRQKDLRKTRNKQNRRG